MTSHNATIADLNPPDGDETIKSCTVYRYHATPFPCSSLQASLSTRAMVPSGNSLTYERFLGKTIKI